MSDIDDKLAWLRRMNIKHHGTPNPPISGKRSEASWENARAIAKRYREEHPDWQWNPTFKSRTEKAG